MQKYGVDVSTWTIPHNIFVSDIWLYGPYVSNSDEAKARRYGQYRQYTETLYVRLDKLDQKIKLKKKECKKL